MGVDMLAAAVAVGVFRQEVFEPKCCVKEEDGPRGPQERPKRGPRSPKSVARASGEQLKTIKIESQKGGYLGVLLVLLGPPRGPRAAIWGSPESSKMAARKAQHRSRECSFA